MAYKDATRAEPHLPVVPCPAAYGLLNMIHMPFCSCLRAALLLQVQDTMMHSSWDPQILQLPNCSVAMNDRDECVWNGPRVRMGICEGSPASVSPHTTSGRADYFGPVVNRCGLTHDLHRLPEHASGSHCMRVTPLPVRLCCITLLM